MRHDVGYGKPPSKTQFKKGQSGNPGGRPKKKNSLLDDIHIELSRKINITENNKKLSVTKQQVIAKKIVQDAMLGDKKATNLILDSSTNAQEKEMDMSELLKQISDLLPD